MIIRGGISCGVIGATFDIKHFNGNTKNLMFFLGVVSLDFFGISRGFRGKLR